MLVSNLLPSCSCPTSVRHRGPLCRDFVFSWVVREASLGGLLCLTFPVAILLLTLIRWHPHEKPGLWVHHLRVLALGR